MKILPFMPTAIIMYWDDSKRHPREFMSYKISCKDGVHTCISWWLSDSLPCDRSQVPISYNEISANGVLVHLCANTF